MIDNSKKFNELREKYNTFIYESFTINNSEDEFIIKFKFTVPNLTTYEPEIRLLKKDIKEAVFAIVFLLSGFIYGKLFPNQEVIQGSIYLIGVAIIGIPVFVTAVKGFLQKDINSSMEILVSIAILVSVLDGQYILAGLIPIILTLVHFLEEKSIMGGRDAIEGLKKLQADTAIVLVDGDEKEVDAKTLKTGDLILVKPGMSLPIDGIVKSGIICGDNGSGKSNLGAAMFDIVRVLTDFQPIPMSFVDEATFINADCESVI